MMEVPGHIKEKLPMLWHRYLWLWYASPRIRVNVLSPTANSSIPVCGVGGSQDCTLSLTWVPEQIPAFLCAVWGDHKIVHCRSLGSQSSTDRKPPREREGKGPADGLQSVQ